MAIKGIVSKDGTVYHVDYNYLENTPDIPDVDETLSRDGAAAGSKAVGTAFEQNSELVGTQKITWESGGMYEGTGIEYAYTGRSRTKFIPVEADADVLIIKTKSGLSNVAIFEFADNTTTTAGNNNRLKFKSVAESVFAYKVDADTNYIRLQINESESTIADSVLLLKKSAFYLDSVYKSIRVYESVSDMKADQGLTVGMYAYTLGYAEAGDNGAGLYRIESGLTANNCTVHKLGNNNYAERIFTSDTVYLESLNFGGVSYSTINNVIAANGIRVVKCGIIETDALIPVRDYDFEFDQIISTYEGYALNLDGIHDHYIKGNILTNTVGSGVLITETLDHFVRNHIEIRHISVNETGILVQPEHGHGVMHNTYDIGVIDAGRYGYFSHIPANTGKYSWQGEDYLSFGNINAHTDDDNGTAVTLYIAPVNNMSVDGTITGLTFAHLGVENSDIGLSINCGSLINTVGHPEAGIKSIIINDMRCREAGWTNTFLSASGYIKELYIKPTSNIKLSQWNFRTSVQNVDSLIDAYVYDDDAWNPIGYGLKCVRNIPYISAPTNSPLIITGDTNFFNMALGTGSGLYMAKYFEVSDALLSDPDEEPIAMNMGYYYLESSQDLIFKLPKSVNGKTVKLEFTFHNIPHGTVKPLIENTDENHDHYYSVSCLTDRTTKADVYVVRDLGIAD